ncbi:MAG: PocR ligand-binding domain-containing protein [Clostridia bacterium]
MQDINSAFDLKLAKDCADSFSMTSGLGCSVSDNSGALLHDVGYSCASCKMCSIAGLEGETCVNAHIYGMVESERFGGKYIYFCPMGLTCFVSPIIDEEHSCAKITVGPFLMVEPEDYISIDIELRKNMDEAKKELLINELSNIPYIEAQKVQSLSVLLYMAVGFLNNVIISGKLVEKQSAEEIQGQISYYIKQLKCGEIEPIYPIDIERKLLRCISESNKADASVYLNDILGHIFFSSNGKIEVIKSRVYELLILISREAINAGADSESSLKMTRNYMEDINKIRDIDSLCLWLTSAVNKLIDSIFIFENLRHSDIIHKALHFIRNNYQEKITLDDTAKSVFLSSSYLSKIFKDETGTSFNKYLNNIRVEKSKTLLLSNAIKLADIASMVGFEDQSYYTKVFKRTTGVLPSKFRDNKGKI